MKIKWNIDTVYVLNIPDWEFEIDDEEIEGLSEFEIEEYINEAVQDQFNENISCSWSSKK